MYLGLGKTLFIKNKSLERNMFCDKVTLFKFKIWDFKPTSSRVIAGSFLQ